jgi:hypothetical protein
VNIKLGDEVKDIITGFKGIVISKIIYLNGCVQWGVKARVELAALKEAEYIDESQLKWISHGINKPEPKSAKKPTEKKEPRAYRGGFQPDGPHRTKRQRKGYY